LVLDNLSQEVSVKKRAICVIDLVLIAVVFAAMDQLLRFQTS